VGEGGGGRRPLAAHVWCGEDLSLTVTWRYVRSGRPNAPGCPIERAHLQYISQTLAQDLLAKGFQVTVAQVLFEVYASCRYKQHLDKGYKG